jgi:hypothetical protein
VSPINRLHRVGVTHKVKDSVVAAGRRANERFATAFQHDRDETRVQAQRTALNWSDPENIEKLKRLLALKMSGGQIGREFNTTRNAIIGAIGRLKEKGIIEKTAFTRVLAQPRDMGKAQAAKRKRTRSPPKDVKAKIRDHNGHVEEVTLKVYEPDPELDDINAKRAPHAKLITDCKGCKWPINDNTPFMFCDDTRNSTSSPYCKAHSIFAGKAYEPRQRGNPHISSPWTDGRK